MAKLINRYALFDAIRNITYNSKDADAFFEEVLEVITEQPTTTEAEIRAKAIDEFAERLKAKCSVGSVFVGCEIRRMVDKLAEQLKGE